VSSGKHVASSYLYLKILESDVAAERKIRVGRGGVADKKR
jgi:hypothetical protein